MMSRWHENPDNGAGSCMGVNNTVYDMAPVIPVCDMPPGAWASGSTALRPLNRQPPQWGFFVPDVPVPVPMN